MRKRTITVLDFLPFVLPGGVGGKFGLGDGDDGWLGGHPINKGTNLAHLGGNFYAMGNGSEKLRRNEVNSSPFVSRNKDR